MERDPKWRCQLYQWYTAQVQGYQQDRIQYFSLEMGVRYNLNV